jgi:preprotein translocase subunit SecG
MILFITILIIISAGLLVLVVLAQNPKGGGISSQFGASSQLMGVKKTGDLLEKLTWGFAISLITLSLLANLILKPNDMTDETGTETETTQPAPQDDAGEE